MDLLEERLRSLQTELFTKNQLVEELQAQQVSEHEHSSELRNKIAEMEKEMADYSGFTDYMNKLKTCITR